MHVTLVHQRELDLALKIALLMIVGDGLADEIGVLDRRPHTVDLDQHLALVGASCTVRLIAFAICEPVSEL